MRLMNVDHIVRLVLLLTANVLHRVLTGSGDNLSSIALSGATVLLFIMGDILKMKTTLEEIRDQLKKRS